MYAGTGWTVHLFPLVVSDIFLADERHRQLSTTAHAAPLLYPPQAALGLAAIPNTEVKHICADNSSKHKIQCYIFRKRKIPSVSWLFLSPLRRVVLVGTPHF